MARKRYSDEDVLNLLRQIELSLASGSSVEMACRSAGISDATYYNWRKRYGGMGKSQLQELKGLVNLLRERGYYTRLWPRSQWTLCEKTRDYASGPCGCSRAERLQAQYWFLLDWFLPLPWWPVGATKRTRCRASPCGLLLEVLARGGRPLLQSGVAPCQTSKWCRGTTNDCPVAGQLG